MYIQAQMWIFAAAAFWQGYLALDGFVPVRIRYQNKLKIPIKKKFCFILCINTFTVLDTFLIGLILSPLSNVYFYQESFL